MSGRFFVQTPSGNRYDFDKLDEWNYTLADIAIHLSRIYRCTGSSDLTVLDHTILVKELVQHSKAFLMLDLDGRQNALAWSLLHDAHECVTGDIPQPLLAWLEDSHSSKLFEVRNAIDRAIAKRYGLQETVPEIVHLADKLAFWYEKTNIFSEETTRDWKLAKPDFESDFDAESYLANVFRKGQTRNHATEAVFWLGQIKKILEHFKYF